MMDYFLSTAQEHNSQLDEHNGLMSTLEYRMMQLLTGPSRIAPNKNYTLEHWLIDSECTDLIYFKYIYVLYVPELSILNVWDILKPHNSSCPYQKYSKCFFDQQFQRLKYY